VPNNDSYQPKDLDAPSTRPTESTSVLENRSQPLTKTEPTASLSSNQRFDTSTSNPVQNQYQARQQDASDDSNKSHLKQEFEHLKDENDQLKDKLKQQELRHRNAGSDRIDNPVVDRQKSNQQQQKGLVVFGVTLNEQLVLVAFVVALLFGFSLGYFLFSCGN